MLTSGGDLPLLFSTANKDWSCFGIYLTHGEYFQIEWILIKHNFNAIEIPRTTTVRCTHYTVPDLEMRWNWNVVLLSHTAERTWEKCCLVWFCSHSQNFSTWKLSLQTKFGHFWQSICSGIYDVTKLANIDRIQNWLTDWFTDLVIDWAV